MKSQTIKIEIKWNHYKVIVVSLMVLGILFTNTVLYSQQAVELKSAIQSLNKSSNFTDRARANQLNSLVYDSHPMFFYKNDNLVTTNSEKPTIGEIDFSQIKLLYVKNSLYENVEFIRIFVSSQNKINDVLNIPLLTHFKSLKYIQFVSTFKCTESLINSLFIPDSRVSVLYSQEIPE